MPTQPLEALRALINKTSPTEGTVLSVEGTNARVATNKGLVAGQLIEGVSVIAGDRVRLEGTSITAKIRASGAIPVFNL
jgi:hypothetical protein